MVITRVRSPKLAPIVLWLGLFLAPMYSHADSDLPELGSSADVVMSAEEKKRLIAEFRNYIQNSLNLVQDPLSNEYIQRLGEKLAAYVDREQTFTFFIVDDPTINAFAGPGGYIGIHTGLIYATRSEDELASVLAHEIAHVTQRHLFRSMDNNSKLTWPAMLAILAAMAVSGQAGGDVGNAIVASTVAGTYQSQLSFSRTYEKEADRVGMQLLAQAGFDPKAMPVFFKTLQQKHQYSETALPEFLRTHPITTSRIADSQSRAAQLQFQKRNEPTNYLLTVSRLYYSQHDKPGQTAFKDYIGTPTAASSLPFITLYEQALIHLQNERYSQARTHMQKLLKLDRARLPYFITQAEIEYKQQKYKNTIQILESARLYYPNNVSLTSLQAQALIDSGKAKQAILELNKQLRLQTNPALYKLKANAATKLKQISVANEAMADYYYLIGNIHSAIKHLQLALENSDNTHIEKLRLKARIQQLKDRLFNKHTLAKENP